MSVRRNASQAAGAACAEADSERRGRGGAATYTHAAAVCGPFPRHAAESYDKADMEAIVGAGDLAGDVTSPACSSGPPEATPRDPAQGAPEADA